MINLYTSINKLQKLQENTRRQSLASALEELADFLKHDLENIILDLYEQQRLADETETEYKREIEAMEKQQELNFELIRAIEERVSA